MYEYKRCMCVFVNKFSKINFKCSCWRKLHQTYWYLQKVTVLLVVQVFWKFAPGIGPLEDNFWLCIMLLVSCALKTFNSQNSCFDMSCMDGQWSLTSYCILNKLKRTTNCTT